MQGIFKIFMELFAPADGGPFARVFMGYFIPGIITSYAIFAIIIGETMVPLKGLPIVPGFAGCLVALMYVGVAGMLHFHWAWGLSHELWHYSVRAKWAAFCFIVACVFAMFVFLTSYHPDFRFL